MTNTTYTAALTVDSGFSAYTVGQMIAEAMATLPDEPLDYSFDPFWDGKARIVLPLTYAAPGIESTQVGTLTLTTQDAVECFAPRCTEAFHTLKEMYAHAKAEHVEVGGPVKA